MEKTGENLKVIGISGSLRRTSKNRQALQVAKRIAGETGADVGEIDLKTLNLPMYDEDIESEGFPPGVEYLRNAIAVADMILIATPEYNHSISGALKNAIDWLSTKKNVLDGKSAAIFGASTGLFGTIRAQIHLRQILAALNVEIVPHPQVFIRSAIEAFNSDGALSDPKTAAQLKILIEKTIRMTKAIKNNNNQK